MSLKTLETIGKVVITPLVAAARIPDMLRSAKSSSLLEYTQITRVEPVTLIDHTISHLPETEDVCATLTALFAGYYLQGIAISHNVGDIDTIKTLSKLNPNRSVTDGFSVGFSKSGVGMEMHSADNYGLKLPRVADMKPRKPDNTPSLSMEAAVDVSLNVGNQYIVDDKDKKDKEDKKGEKESVTASIGNSAKEIKEMASNLSTGIMLEVQLESKGTKATIPVSVRLIASPTSPEILKNLLGFSFKNRSIKERWHGWRSGELSFIKDIVFCQDIIDAHRESMMKDDNDAYHEIVARKNRNRWSGLFSSTPSVATASNIIVLSSETARDIEKDVGMRFENFKHRQKIFKAAYMMLIVVMDVRNQMVTIYHRDIKIPTEASMRELKRNAKNSNGGDVIEYLNAYMLGTNPTF